MRLSVWWISNYFSEWRASKAERKAHELPQGFLEGNLSSDHQRTGDLRNRVLGLSILLWTEGPESRQICMAANNQKRQKCLMRLGWLKLSSLTDSPIWSWAETSGACQHWKVLCSWERFAILQHTWSSLHIGVIFWVGTSFILGYSLGSICQVKSV